MVRDARCDSVAAPAGRSVKRYADPTGRSLQWEPVDGRPDRMLRLEQRDLLRCSMQRLEPEQRSIFLLREVEELSYREIAATLGIPEGTVGSRLNRVRRALKYHLRELGWDA